MFVFLILDTAFLLVNAAWAEWEGFNYRAKVG